MWHELDVGEESRDGDAPDADEPAHCSRQPANVAEWRADATVAPGDMVPLRTQAIVRQLHALDADFCMALVADVATAARALMRVDVVGEAGGRPLLWQRWCATDVAGEAYCLFSQMRGAWLMFVAREVVQAEGAST